MIDTTIGDSLIRRGVFHSYLGWNRSVAVAVVHVNFLVTVEIFVEYFLVSFVLPPATKLAIPATRQAEIEFRMLEGGHRVKVLIT